jgi:hypothetical protein
MTPSCRIISVVARAASAENETVVLAHGSVATLNHTLKWLV